MTLPEITPEVWVVLENAPDARGGPDSVWSTQEAAERRAEALSVGRSYNWYVERYTVDEAALDV